MGRLHIKLIFERNGEVKWCAGGIFTNLWERRMAEYFPLFGSPCHNLDALTHIVNKYRLNAITLDSLDLSVRTSNCLRKENIETFDVILMMYPYQLRQIENLGEKSVRELQETAEDIFGIEVDK
ncbi:MAG: DNA-directed RNA polymerase subunit alpha C-terminal domain-containing protein [Pseudomonadota bacterium]